MKKLLLILNLSLLILFSGCSDNDSPVINTDNEDVSTEAVDDNLSLSDVSIKFTSAQKTQNDLINLFSLKLLGALNNTTSTDNNLVFSPVSEAISLVMMGEADNGSFRQSVSNVFGSRDFTSLSDVASQLNAALDCERNGAFLSVANSVWLHNTLNPTSEYVSSMNQRFDAPVNIVDLHTPDTQLAINTWVSDNTRGLIPSIYSQPLEDEIAAVWINALMFEGTWQDKFDKSETTAETFHGTNANNKVPMMHRRFAMTLGAELDGYKMARIIFGALAEFIVVLPPEGTDISEATDFLAGTGFNKLSAASSFKRLDLSMPRFSIENSLNMNSALESLGLSMNPDRLSGIGAGTIGTIGLQHKATIKLDEDGASAAAVSYNMWCTSTGEEQKIDNLSINLNRPFLFFVREGSTNTIIFAGRITNL